MSCNIGEIINKLNVMNDPCVIMSLVTVIIKALIIITTHPGINFVK